MLNPVSMGCTGAIWTLFNWNLKGFIVGKHDPVIPVKQTAMCNFNMDIHPLFRVALRVLKLTALCLDLLTRVDGNFTGFLRAPSPPLDAPGNSHWDYRNDSSWESSHAGQTLSHICGTLWSMPWWHLNPWGRLLCLSRFVFKEKAKSKQRKKHRMKSFWVCMFTWQILTSIP